MGKNDPRPNGVNAVWPIADSSGVLPPGANAYDRQAEPNGAGTIDLNIATLWRIAWQWRVLILAGAAAGLGLAVVVTLLTTPAYRSTAVVEINPPAVEVIDSAKTPATGQNDALYLETQRGLLESRSLAERVTQDLNLIANPILAPDQEMDRAARQQLVSARLRRNLEVKVVEDSRLIQISFSSEDPALAARVINGYADAFISTSLERRYQASSYARNFLQTQIAKIRSDLEKSERDLVAYAQQQGIISTQSTSEGSPSDVASLTGESLIALNKALVEAQTQRIEAEMKYRASQAGRPSAEAGERTSAIRAQLAAAQAEYQDKLAIYRPDYPELVRLRERMNALRNTIRAEEQAVNAGRSGTLFTDYQAALSREKELRSRVSAARGDVLDLRGRSIRYAILQRDVDTNRALYDALLQRFKEIGVAGGIGVSNASIVDRGDVPPAPYKPDLFFNLVIGLALGLGAALGTALLLEFVNDTVSTPDDVRERLGLAFLGGIPVSKGKKPVEALQDPASPLSEAYFSAGTSLQFATDNGAPKTMLITSTRPAEGKSTSTWALAQHFTKLGKRVLLIDADMRKPAFVTGHEKEDGLSNLLTTRDPITPHLQLTDTENLWLLPCGPIPPNPAELLASSRMKAVIAEAAEEFDMVIVDGPPILGLADSPLLSTICDGTLMVIEAGKTRTRAASEALNRILTAGSHVVGALLTRYRHEATGYGYSYEPYSYRSVENREREIRAVTGDDA